MKTKDTQTMEERVYDVLKNVPGFDLLGMDQQGELVMKTAREFGDEVLDRIMEDTFKTSEERYGVPVKF